MSANENDELFDLIHSLTKAERRYFKVQFLGTAHGEMSKYMKVFDAIAEMPSFSKAALEKKFRNQNLIRYYSKTKAYLIDAVLDSMRNFHRGQSHIDAANLDLANLRFLLSKGLTDHFQRHLHQLKQHYLEAELLISLLQVLEIEDSYRADMLMDATDVQQEIERTISWLKQESDATKLNRQVYALYSKVGVRPDKAAQKNILALRSSLDALAPSLNCLSAKIRLNSASALCCHMLGENIVGLELLKKNVELYLSAPSRFFKGKETPFLRLLGNCATYAFNHRDLQLYREVCAYIDERVHLVRGLDDVKFEMSASQLFCEISLSGDYSNFQKRAEYIEQHQDQLKAISVLRRGDITFNISLGFFKTSSLAKALEWLLRFFDTPNIEDRTNVYIYARIYEILLHWYLGNSDLVSSRTLSFKRYLLKRDRLGEFEKALIKFINATVKSDTRLSFSRALASLGDDLKLLDKVEYAGIVQNYTDLIDRFSEKEAGISALSPQKRQKSH